MEGLSAPAAIAVDGTGHLYILDSGNNEVDRYQVSAGDTYSYDIGFLGGARSALAGTSLAQPTDLALRGTNLYVLDAANTRVVRIDLVAGTAVVAVSDPSWSQASGIAADSAGSIYVADTFNHRIRKYASGGAAATIGTYGTGTGQLRLPRALALDGADNLFVADSGNHRVQVFDPAGTSVSVIGSSSVFGSIKGLALDPADRLYVSDGARNVVYVFAAAAAGPIIRIGTPVLECGSVGVGYAYDRPLAVHNDGSSDLTVTGIVSTSSRFIPRQATPFQIPAGGVKHVLVRFAPTAAGFVTGTLALTSDSTSGPTSSVVLRGTGITPPLVDAILVLDRSGSMSASIGNGTEWSPAFGLVDVRGSRTRRPRRPAGRRRL